MADLEKKLKAEALPDEALDNVTGGRLALNMNMRKRFIGRLLSFFEGKTKLEKIAAERMLEEEKEGIKVSGDFPTVS